jgi:hypothetical protein
MDGSSRNGPSDEAKKLIPLNKLTIAGKTGYEPQTAVGTSERVMKVKTTWRSFPPGIGFPDGTNLLENMRRNKDTMKR